MTDTTSKSDIRIGDTLILARRDGTSSYECAHCSTSLGPGTDNYKNGCKLIESPVTDIAPEFHSTDPEMAAKMTFRQFICPGCGIRLDTEIARVGDEPLWDIRLDDV